jgi:hypothetical protein
MKLTRDQLRQGLEIIAETDIKDDANVWPSIQKRMAVQSGEIKMNESVSRRTAVKLWQVAAVVVVIILIALAIPPVRTFAQDIFGIVRQIGGTKLIRGPIPTEAIEPLPEIPPEEYVLPSGGLFSVAEVTEVTGFGIYEPTDIPAGYEMNARVPNRKGEVRGFRVGYSRLDEDGTVYFIELSQVLWPENAPSQFGMWDMGDAPIEDVTVRGHNGVFVEGAPILYTEQGVQGVNLLIWEEDGFTFTLQSDEFSRDEMIRIAESISPAN